MQILTYDPKKKFLVAEGICYNLPSEQYHSGAEGYSSSQVKEANGDIEIFYDKYIAKTVEREEKAVFDTGTAFHTAVLEPDQYSKEVICYKGTRRGTAWEAFKKHNPKKIIISPSQQDQVDRLVAGVNESPIAIHKLSPCKVEVSAFVKIYVSGSDVYHIASSSILGKYGWEKIKKGQKVPAVGISIWIKARADGVTIRYKKNYCIDLKSMSGNVKSKHDIKSKVSDLNYDLSAAFYLDIFSAVTREPYFDFFWIFASKDLGKSKTYVASTDNILIGRAKWKKGILAIAHGLKTEWAFDDFVEVLEPNLFEYENIREKDNGADLL